MNETKLDRPLSCEALVAQKLMAETLLLLENFYDTGKTLPDRTEHMKTFANQMQLAIEQVYIGRRDVCVQFLGVHQRPFGFDVSISVGDQPAKKFRFMMTESQIVCKQMA